MADQQIEFRKIRDFGENLNDTFLYIRLNFAPLMKSFFAICAVFMLAFAIFSSMYQSKIIHVFDQLQKGMDTDRDTFRNVFDLNYFLMIVFGLLTYVSMKVAFNAYVKYQLENNNARPGIEAVWKLFRQYFFRVLFYSLLLWLIIAIVTVFIAGLISFAMFASLAAGIFLIMLMFMTMIYMLTLFTPFDSIIILEDAGFYEAFTRCFELIKNNFLLSLGIYFISFMIYAICGGVIAMIASGITGLSAYVTTSNVSASVRIGTSVMNIFSYTFFIIFLISSTLHYFCLVERRDGTGIMQRINSIGTGKNDFDHTEEHY